MQLRDWLKEIRYGKWEDKTMDFVKEHYWDDYIPLAGATSLGTRQPGVKRRWRFPVVHQL
jgi:hypothetical protein